MGKVLLQYNGLRLVIPSMVYLLYCATDWPAFGKPPWLTQIFSLSAFLFLLKPVNHISNLLLTHFAHFAAMTKGRSGRVIGWPHSGPLTHTHRHPLRLKHSSLFPDIHWLHSGGGQPLPAAAHLHHRTRAQVQRPTAGRAATARLCHCQQLLLQHAAQPKEPVLCHQVCQHILSTGGQEETWHYDCEYGMCLTMSVFS